MWYCDRVILCCYIDWYLARGVEIITVIHWSWLLLMFFPLFDIVIEEDHIECFSSFDDSSETRSEYSGDPLFLQNSNHPGMTLVSSVLTGNNHLACSRSIKIVWGLRSNYVLTIVDDFNMLYGHFCLKIDLVFFKFYHLSLKWFLPNFKWIMG